ncbi:hypothetical protein PQX77_005539, partial [Marasmius sp. AFHP31]
MAHGRLWRVFIKAEAARECLGDQSPEPDLTDNEIFDVATPAAEWWIKTPNFHNSLQLVAEVRGWQLGFDQGCSVIGTWK